MTLIKRNNYLNDYAPVTFSSLLDGFFNENLTTPTKATGFTPKVDIVETDNEFELHTAVPGMDKKDFTVDFNDGKLTISGERKFNKEEKGKNYRSLETQYGSFSRSFHMTDNIASEKISANYENGILTVVVPKDERKVLKSTIEVK